MATGTGERSQFFPAIEKKHGHPVSHWFERLTELGDARYPEQIAHLREEHGFSQAHANAVVMQFRGSTTSRRHATPEAWFTAQDAAHAKTARAIFKAIMAKHPALELVVAWNQPMLRNDAGYVFGLSAAKNHLLINPMSTAALAKCAPKLKGYKVSKHTIKLPLDWKVDVTLLNALVKARLAELK